MKTEDIRGLISDISGGSEGLSPARLKAVLTLLLEEIDTLQRDLKALRGDMNSKYRSLGF